MLLISFHVLPSNRSVTGAAEVSPPGAVVFVPSVVKVLKVVAGRSVAEKRKIKLCCKPLVINQSERLKSYKSTLKIYAGI